MSQEEEDNKKFISEQDAKKDTKRNNQVSKCPECGSYNTGSATWVDFCRTCGWEQGYI